jgi:putative ABC transport system substrate-binding protein
VSGWCSVGGLALGIYFFHKSMELFVTEATAFELIVNSRTASALGLTVPPNILLRADDVIE